MEEGGAVMGETLEQIKKTSREIDSASRRLAFTEAAVLLLKAAGEDKFKEMTGTEALVELAIKLREEAKR